MTTTPSDTIFDTIKASAGQPKSVRALENVKEVCDYLVSKGTPITPAEVGQITANRKGGPLERSLRNNKNLMAYVRARQAEQKLPPVGSGGTPNPVKSGIPHVDAYIYSLEVALQAKRNESKGLHSLIAHSGLYSPTESIDQGKLILANLSKGQLPPASSTPINKNLAIALAKIIDPKHIVHFGLVIEKDHIVSPERNLRILLDSTDVAAIRAALQDGSENPIIELAPKQITA